ncbi:MAG: alpha/beta hydrolase [Bacteroidota bacterium]
MKNAFGLTILLLLCWGCNSTAPSNLFIKLVRKANDPQEEKITIGPYADAIMQVKEFAPVNVPVAGLPDAQLTCYAPKEASMTPLPMILFIHGGGWVSGSARNVASYAKLIASNGYLVANLEYALAPEFPYPAPVLQSVACLDYLVAHAAAYHGDPTRFFIAGNSAGAQIASQLGAMVSNPNLKQKVGVSCALSPDHVKGVILFNGVFNFATAGETNFPGFAQFAWSYTGEKDYVNFARIDELSTVKNVTPAYPATFLTAGDADPLEPQTYELDEALTAQQVPVTRIYWTDTDAKLQHDYMYKLDTEAAQEVYQKLVAFLADKAEGK